MATANLSLGQVNITGYLQIIARKTSNPTVVAASIPPFIPPAAPINISIPGLEPVPHYIDFRESPDGIALGTLLATYVYDVRNQAVTAELRYYKTDGPKPTDPASGQSQIIDEYLNGKTITGVFKEGQTRPLAPPTEDFKEYDLIVGGGIELLNGLEFAPFEITVIWIGYIVDSGGGSDTPSGFLGSVVITASITLDFSYFNYRIKCHSATSRQVITMPFLGDVPDNTIFYFTTNRGSQFQTKFVTQGGELFEHAGEDVQEITLGKGEFLYIIKYDTRFEVHQCHSNVLRVGERFSGRWKDHMNALPENDALLSGDDYPRAWYWMVNKLPNPQKIVTTEALIAAFVRDAGKEGLPIITSDGKSFRMPNTQGWYERGLNSFTAYGTDAARTYDYPGGSQTGQVGEISFDLPKGDCYLGHSESGRFGPGGNLQTPQTITVNGGKENRVKDIGVIYMMYI